MSEFTISSDLDYGWEPTPDFLDKPIKAGGLALSRFSASAALLLFIAMSILIFQQRAARRAH